MKVEECRSVKYLGVLIDKELKFTDHINQVLKKLSKAFGIVSKLRHFVSKDVTVLYSITISTLNLSYYKEFLSMPVRTKRI